MNSREIVLEMDLPFLPSRQLKAGNIELLYEQGRVRYIKYKGREVLRMIYPALRDENWVTIKPEMHNENISIDESSFAISYQLTYEIGYRAEFEIKGNQDELVYVMKGEALKSFKSKRIGLCVHHPIPPCAGKEINIVHEGGKNASYIFPELISADRPFTDIISMQWKTSNAEAKIDFEGDVFETEDQRNWTDDSYKTYSGPQYKTPMLNIKQGEKMMHKVTLSVNEVPVVPGKEQEKPLHAPFPKIGYSRSNDQAELTDKEIELIKQIPFDHYRVNLDLVNINWKTVLRSARKEAEILNTKIELVISFKAAEQADELINEIKNADDISNIAVLAKDHYPEIQSRLEKSFPQLNIGFAVGGWFADLNSALPLDAPYDFVSFKVSPQVHQDDSRSILENLGSQYTVIETIKNKAGNRTVHVSPVMFNHNGDDGRLHTSFGAWWTINTICNFAAGGHITLFELKGPRGIIHDENNQSPLYRLLKTIKDFGPEYILKLKKNEIAIQNKKGDRIIFHKKSIHE